MSCTQDYKLNVVSEEFSILEGSYNFNNDSFDLSYKFIACKAGTFFLRQVSHTSNVEEQHFKDKCPGLNVDIWVNMNSLENYPGNNIELLTESPDPHYNTDLLANPKSQFYHFGGYCFKVLP